MAEAYISRRESRVKTGTFLTGSDGYLKSITTPDLVGAKNAILFEYNRPGSTSSAEGNAIVTVCIEDGAIVSATMIRDGNDHTDYIDLSYINFNASTGTISVADAGSAYYKNAFFRQYTNYKYIIY